MKDIKNFRIGTANYMLENEGGTRIRLELNYAKNTFSYEILVEGRGTNKLIRQAGIIAKDMLSRKAKKNLSYKLLQLKV